MTSEIILGSNRFPQMANWHQVKEAILRVGLDLVLHGSGLYRIDSLIAVPNGKVEHTG